MNKDIVHMPDPREEALIRQALTALVQDEMDQAEADETLAAEYRRTLPAVQKHVEAACAPEEEQKPRRGRRSLRAALLIAAVLVAFSGVCLASPEIRENLFVLVESTVGGRTQLHVQSAGDPEPSDSLITVDPDDPRLRYVHPDWCLHYYPLEVPSSLNDVNVQGVNANWSQTMWEVRYEGEDELRKVESGFYYLDDEAREAILAYDYQEIVFENPDNDEVFIRFTEDGREMNCVTYDKEAVWEKIDGRDVAVIEENDMTTYVWQEDDHLLTLSSSVGRWEMDAIFASIERIR